MRIFIWGLMIAMVGVWALTGGIHWGSALVMSVLAIAGAVAVTILGGRGLACEMPPGNGVSLARFHGFGAFGWLLLGMMALCAISIVPMPLGLLEILSPKAAEWYRESWNLMEMPDNWGTISVSAGRTAYGLMHLCGFFGLYVMGMRLACTRDVVNKICHGLLIGGGILILMTGMKFAGFPVSIGETGEMAAYHIGLPVNANHASGALVLMSLMSLGCLLSKRHRDVAARRGLWALFYVIFGVMIVMLQSRGALFAWACGHVFIGIFAWSRSRQLSLHSGAIVLGAVSAILAVVLYLSADTLGTIKNEFEETHVEFSVDDADLASSAFSKTQLYGDFAHMSADWRRMGIGRSAFADAYPAYQSFAFPKRFRHAENEYWEWVIEYGWFFGSVFIVLLLLGFILQMRTFWRAADERAHVIGWMCGALAIAIQSLFDFGLRYWTVGFVFWFGCGLVQARGNRWTYGRIEHDKTEISAWRRREWYAGHIIFALSVLSMLGALPMAVDGQTEQKLRALPESLAQTDLPQHSSLLANNLRIRNASDRVRTATASTLVSQSRALSGNARMYAWKQARRWFESALYHAPNSAMTSLRLGKVCQALGDNTCASEQYLLAASHDPRLASAAMDELSTLPNEYIQLPPDDRAARSLITRLIDENRLDIALSLIDKMKNPELAAEMRIDIYLHLDMDEAADMALQAIQERPMTLTRLRLQCDRYIRTQQFDEMLVLLESAEASLRHEPEYWKMRLYHSVWYGKVRGDEWYRDAIPGIFLRFRQFSNASRNWQFDNALCDAQFALQTDQLTRAIRSANQALSLRPNHKGALAILQAAQTKMKMRNKSLGGLDS